MQPLPLDLESFRELPERARPNFSPPTLSGSRVNLPRLDLTGLDKRLAKDEWVSLPSSSPTLAERLFDATAEAKIWTSKVAMHLDPVARKRFFLQLDRLHDEEEWAGDDLPVNLESYKTFIRTVVKCRIQNGPSLALMPSGNLLAMWHNAAGRLSVEFLPDGRTKWVLSRGLGGTIERAAGETRLERLKAVLMPYDADGWFLGR